MEQYLEFAKRIAKEAEQIALDYFGFDVETTWKDDSSPLTLADTEINDLVIKRVNETYPDHSIYGEEKSHIKEKDNSKYIWVCDPIDGTMAFSCGLPIFVFSLALVDRQTGLPLLGIVNDPIMKNMYWAYKGGGAYRNNKKINVQGNSSLRETYINIASSGKSIGYSSLPFIKIAGDIKCRVMILPSIIYGGIQVANGKYSGCVFFKEYGHDVAALKVITEEAGGKVTDLEGKERRYDGDGAGCVISNGLLHDEILKIIKTCKL